MYRLTSVRNTKQPTERDPDVIIQAPFVPLRNLFRHTRLLAIRVTVYGVHFLRPLNLQFVQVNLWCVGV